MNPRIRWAGIGLAIAGTATAAGLAYSTLSPVNSIGPFDETKTAFIRSEDGVIEVSNAQIRNGVFYETKDGKEIRIGPVKKGGNNSFSIGESDNPAYKCLSHSKDQAVCGSVRFQKSLGKFQFDRKIPFNIQETVFALPIGVSASARQNATVMFDSADGSLWVKSEKVGSYKFLTPSTFRIQWRSPLINYDGSGYSAQMTTRTAECTINREAKESVLCNGVAANGIGSSYSAIWTFIDSSDAKGSTGGTEPPPSIMNSHD